MKLIPFLAMGLLAASACFDQPGPGPDLSTSQLTVDSRLGSPIGMSCVEDPAELGVIAAGGFNAVHSYRFESAASHSTKDALEFLHAAADNKMRVMMGIPQEWVWGADVWNGEPYTVGVVSEVAIRERVRALRGHRALLGWELYDEPEGAGQSLGLPPLPPENLAAAYQLIHEDDAAHPVTIANRSRGSRRREGR